MEAGNRYYDDRVPEKINRRVVDHCSNILLPYTERSRANLLKEGIEGERIYVTGNPIWEVLTHYSDRIAQSEVLQALGVGCKGYFLVTLHRAENVDDEARLAKFITAFQRIYEEYRLPLICSLHSRTRSQLEKQNRTIAGTGIQVVKPPGLFDFVRLEQNSYCVLSDSGTVQEECCLYKIPNVTLRDVTERPETLEVGSNLIAGCEPEAILRAVKTVLSQGWDWEPPAEYMVQKVSKKLVKIIMSEVQLSEFFEYKYMERCVWY
ncbi:UDP-N-acetyl glucosamine 2-epimerase [Desulfosporosinus fructosivorans]|uniref:UDP-N-acetyl glucosamine 2-epimerase n=1 Tax=Desulfosporosinus fructosivorans TaxID=2018669 RepID=UPI001FB18A70|nr:UDP-N-acetylglucosamine 2-epimerase [Desulfosporosinus fructosivorans]